MAQDRYAINGRIIHQPDADIPDAWETTYSEDSCRSQGGSGHFTPLFTVWRHTYKATHIPVSEATWIIQTISTGLPFTYHCWSSKYGGWVDLECYVGKSTDCVIGRLEEGREYYSSFSFNATEVDAE